MNQREMNFIAGLMIKQAISPKWEMAGRGVGAGLGGILGYEKGNPLGTVLNAAEFLPGVGTFASLGNAGRHFYNGKYWRGLGSLATAPLGLIGGTGLAKATARGLSRFGSKFMPRTVGRGIKGVADFAQRSPWKTQGTSIAGSMYAGGKAEGAKAFNQSVDDAANQFQSIATQMGYRPQYNPIGSQ